MTNSPSSFREDEIIFNPMQEVRVPGSLSQLEWVVHLEELVWSSRSVKQPDCAALTGARAGAAGPGADRAGGAGQHEQRQAGGLVRAAELPPRCTSSPCLASCRVMLCCVYLPLNIRSRLRLVVISNLLLAKWRLCAPQRARRV